MALYPPPTRRQVENAGLGVLGAVLMFFVGVFEFFWYLLVALWFVVKVALVLLAVGFFVWPLPLVIMGFMGEPKLLLFGLWWVVIVAIAYFNNSKFHVAVKDQLVAVVKLTGFVR